MELDDAMLRLDGRVRIEQTRMMYQTPVIPMLNVLTAGITAAALSRVFPPLVLIGWIAAFIIVAAWRLYSWRLFTRSDQTVATEQWRHRFVGGAVATGLLWGLAGSVVFVTGDPGYHVFVVFVIGGMTAGAVVGNATYMPAFYGFALPAIMPMAMALFILGDSRSVEMALLMLAFSAVLAVAGRNMHRWIESTTRLQIERELLIDRLQHATETLEREVMTSRDRETTLQDITAALEDQTRSVHLLNGMVQRLQEATTDQELTEIVAGYAPQIVPGRPGALFLMNNSQNLLTAIASWGDATGTRMDFPPDNCWALRRSQTHFVQADGREVRCQHVHPTFSGSYACYPLLGRGGIVGLLYIEADAAAAGHDDAMNAFAGIWGWRWPTTACARPCG